MTPALLHRRIVNTRAPHQAAALDELLRVDGAEPVAYPCIDIVVSNDPLFERELRDLAAGHYQWLALTSPNAVLALATRARALGISLDNTAFRTAAIGPATRDAAREQLGITPHVLPEEFVAESLAECVPVAAHDRVLLPESDLARPVLGTMLRERGAEVAIVVAYRTVCGSGGADLPRLLADSAIDALAFTSPSTVANFIERIAREGGSLEKARAVCAACIGPVTADAARGNGFTNVLEASEYTLSGLTRAISEFFAGRPAGKDRS